MLAMDRGQWTNIFSKYISYVVEYLENIYSIVNIKHISIHDPLIDTFPGLYSCKRGSLKSVLMIKKIIYYCKKPATLAYKLHNNVTNFPIPH